MSEMAVATARRAPVSEQEARPHEFSQYKELLFMLAWRDIKIRYKQSIMGFAWAILMPVLIIGSGLIVTVAFSTLSGKPVNKLDVLSVAVKAVPWAFFVGAIRFATHSLIMNKELVTKIYFPREILPFAAVLANLFDFAVAGVVLVLTLAATRVGVSVYLLWVPVLLLLLICLSAGLGILLACANLFFRDVKYLVEVVLTYGIFFTPVFYSARALGKWGVLLMFNPVGPILEGLRSTVILHQSPELGWLAYSAAWAVLGLVSSWAIFKRSETSFAESI
jgi:ABC-type polysaccharide/polyol phosphate export permease